MTSRPGSLASAALLLGLVALCGPVVPWLLRTLSAEENRLHLVLAVGGGLWLLWDPSVLKDILESAKVGPRWRAAPALVLFVGALGVALARRGDVQTGEAMCAGIALYGALGLYRDPAGWAAARGPALLLALLVPASAVVEAVLGYPARWATARIVQSALGILGIGAVSTETVLLLDRGAAYVDLPCAGLRSLWSGGIFLLGFALVSRRAVGPGFAAIGVLTGAGLVVANVLRVGILVLLDQGVGLPAVADALHVPLGIVGFGTVCVFAAGLISLLPAQEIPEVQVSPEGASSASHFRVTGLAAAALLALALVRAPPVEAEIGLPVLAPPAAFHPIPAELTPAEIAFYRQVGATATRWRVGGEAPAAVALVPSRSWRAHHLPEQCVAMAGHRVEGTRPAEIAGVPVRIADVDGTRLAIWWYQSDRDLTDDWTRRVLSATTRPDDAWVLVSILTDGPADPASVAPLVLALRDSVAAGLKHTLEKS